MLPEKWCTLITKENEADLHKWYTEHMEGYINCKPEWRLGIGRYFHYPSKDGSTHSTYKHSLKDYIEISFEEFKQETEKEYFPLIFN